MVRIDRRSGQRVFGAWPTSDPRAAVIWEAFRPESEPRRTIRRDEAAPNARSASAARARRPRPRTAAPAQQNSSDDFLQREEGIY